jgi:hypothetical protein
MLDWFPLNLRFCPAGQRVGRSVTAQTVTHRLRSSFGRRHQERFATAPTRSKTQPQAHDRAGGLADPAATALGGVVPHQQGEAADTSCAMCPITRSPDQSQSANVCRDTCPNPQLSQDRRPAHSVLPWEVGSAGTRNTTYDSTLPCIESDPQERRGRLRAETASQIVMISTQRSLRLRPSGLGLE